MKSKKPLNSLKKGIGTVKVLMEYEICIES